MAGRLDGRVAVITGSAQGIGWVYAEAMAKEGAKIVINDVTDCEKPAQALRDSGAEAIGIQADVTDLGAMEEAVQRTVDVFGSVDVLVNNAAIFAGLQRRSFFDIPMDEWDKVIHVNITGTFVPIRAFAQQMKKQGSGKIVNISSAVVATGIPDFVHYTTSKSAVIGMTRAMARELGPSGISINAVMPGYVMAPSNEGNPKSVDDMNVSRRSIQRTGYPADVVGTVLYLSTSESDFVTGQSIIVDGGICFG